MTTNNNYVLLDRAELTSSVSSVTFSNIPQSGYTDLKILVSSRQDGSIYPSSVDLGIKFNTSSSNFSSRYIIDSNNTIYNGTATNLAGLSAASTHTGNNFSSVEIYIPNYLSSNYKSYSINAVTENNGTVASIGLYSGIWSQTATINSISIIDFYNQNLIANSTFSLYGIAAKDTVPTTYSKGVGGTTVTSGGYKYHTFTGSGSFAALDSLTVDYIVVGGGGGNAYRFGGGGGAGGFISKTSVALSPGTYNVTVGAGGAENTNGSDSAFYSSLAIGGGYGAGDTYRGAAAGMGGSGGGGYGYGTGRGGSALATGQGYAGGFGATNYRNGGGGGGAGAVGENAASSYGGNGGVGVYSTLTDAIGAATTTGELVSGHYYYAGGGGGGSNLGNGGDPGWAGHGEGGYGGGGNGGASGNGGGSDSNQAGENGTANTGGGAGGNSQATGAKSGGSGIVIIRYAV